jgi:hypothetical protein
MLITAFLLVALAGCTGDDEGPTPNIQLPTPTSAAPTVQPDSPGGTMSEAPPAVPSEGATS